MINLTIVGNVGSADLKQVGDTSVLNFTVASNRRYTNNAGEKVEETTWVRVAIWGKYAQAMAPHITKGKAVAVIADRIRVNAYINKDGQAAASLEVTASNVTLMGGGNGNGQQAQVAEASSDPFADEGGVPF